MRYAAIEAGGTSWVVAIAEGDPSNIIERADFQTTPNPSEVLTLCVNWLKDKKFDCIGIASFGPVELHEDSLKYGYITTTPKPGWKDANVVGFIRKGLNLSNDFPIGFDTDVNAPAMAEYLQALERGESITSCAYVTVGTGIGVGFVFNGHMLHGLLHGEGGHISVPPYPGPGGVGTTKIGNSLNCPTWIELETVCNSAGLAARAGCSIGDLKNLSDNHEVWDIAAHYLACLCVNMILMSSPELIVLSGGVLLRKCLLPKIHLKTAEYLNGYIDVPKLSTPKGIESLIVRSTHGNCAGIVGALYLAKNAHNNIVSSQSKPQPTQTEESLTGNHRIVLPFLLGVVVTLGFMKFRASF
mmetsp:Transcript_10187/g.12363  ORF Transcript_10187/g.12363 Transcript_10187/m.12363 type:complete len:356 (+) Transcript_10187:74-1141(+)|eukprot:CAMPEP_0114333232 /NCGR_PEP_ID=MMETSP0101-20121206/3632_1 /TAXON_ID=38822 ORGANISM="Pteridomonas danica, Strain PT" /NCGR_SAMPLE_ID=MMETSP0101 /ASSEMBLY_ACC=CAM_ASM_000211 /LENGTH=355 /DNA_ID=CAMNT_0001464211 /DNA_START=27 /DNA_END=1094 /DNA_ORIENTATION=+